MKNLLLTPKEIASFQKIVYEHFATYGRHFPWRETTDRYAVMVCEVMLQQTPVTRVVEKYPKFLKQFPTLESLSRAKLGTILKAWSGLGYNKRAYYLWQTARIITSKGGVTMLTTIDEWQQLPGIGINTAAAIMAFADNQPVVFIETNIRSVMLEHFFKERVGVTDAQLLDYVATTLDRFHPRKWYNAMMDYGAWLKRKRVNPSRRSAHYKRQTPFTGSNRQVRGMIIAQLNQGELTMTELCRKMETEPKKIKAAIKELLREGLVSVNAGIYCLP